MIHFYVADYLHFLRKRILKIYYVLCIMYYRRWDRRRKTGGRRRKTGGGRRKTREVEAKLMKINVLWVVTFIYHPDIHIVSGS